MPAARRKRRSIENAGGDIVADSSIHSAPNADESTVAASSTSSASSDSFSSTSESSTLAIAEAAASSADAGGAASAAAASDRAAWDREIDWSALSGLPKNFDWFYPRIVAMRRSRDAPVDSVGCDKIQDANAPDSARRFQVLVALMLSSQTKDAQTGAAMANLHKHFAGRGGLTVPNVLNMAPATLNDLIRPVGFRNRKTEYLMRTAKILHENYNDDIPRNLKELLELPGVGPKMAHLCMTAAWNDCVGIGVDVHVHRISNRLRWVKTNTPEQTREALQEFVPRELWTSINELLVGFGQQTCAAVRPKCPTCLCLERCTYGRQQVRAENAKEKKRAKKKPKIESAASSSTADGEPAAENVGGNAPIESAEDAGDAMFLTPDIEDAVPQNGVAKKRSAEDAESSATDAPAASESDSSRAKRRRAQPQSQ
jgi:endonuclease-3